MDISDKAYRGDIYLADYGEVFGAEQSGLRPVTIIQNDIGNKYSPTVIVSAITSKINKMHIPTHVYISNKALDSDSVIMLEQIRTIDKRKLREKLGALSEYELRKLNGSLALSIGLLQRN